MVPSSGRSRPATSRSVVDFPHPDGPISVSNSPGAASSRSESAATTPPHDSLTPSSTRAGIGSPGEPARPPEAAAAAPVITSISAISVHRPVRVDELHRDPPQDADRFGAQAHRRQGHRRRNLGEARIDRLVGGGEETDDVGVQDAEHGSRDKQSGAALHPDRPKCRVEGRECQQYADAHDSTGNGIAERGQLGGGPDEPATPHPQTVAHQQGQHYASRPVSYTHLRAHETDSYL